MEFISGLMWGTGLSLGICAGLVTWVFLREGVNRLLGVTSYERNTFRQFNKQSLEALSERNRLTCKTNALLERLAIRFEQDYEPGN